MWPFCNVQGSPLPPNFFISLNAQPNQVINIKTQPVEYNCEKFQSTAKNPFSFYNSHCLSAKSLLKC